MLAFVVSTAELIDQLTVTFSSFNAMTYVAATTEKLEYYMCFKRLFQLSAWDILSSKFNTIAT